jgi:hypothetical protein
MGGTWFAASLRRALLRAAIAGVAGKTGLILPRLDSPDGHLEFANRLRGKSNFAFPFKLIWVVQSPAQKYIGF